MCWFTVRPYLAKASRKSKVEPSKGVWSDKTGTPLGTGGGQGTGHLVPVVATKMLNGPQVLFFSFTTWEASYGMSGVFVSMVLAMVLNDVPGLEPLVSASSKQYLQASALEDGVEEPDSAFASSWE